MVFGRLILVGADHGGFEVKEKLIPFLQGKGFKVQDVGAFHFDPNDDYVGIAISLSRKVAGNKSAMGLLVCGSGSGMAIAANKVKGIRAVVCYDHYSAQKAREDNDANVLVLRARGGFSLARNKKIVETFFSTPFSKASRHLRRINQISKYEV